MNGALVTLGETMGLLHSERTGSLLHEDRMVFGIGGAESNVAIGVARLGGESVWIGRLGDDSIGARVLRELRAEGVVTRATVEGQAQTGLMVKERPIAGASRVWYYRSGSAGSRLSPADVQVSSIEQAGILHVTGITLALSATARDSVFFALDVARDVGVPVSFDVNHRPSLWSDDEYAVLYRRIAERAEIIFAGESEAAILTEARSPESMAERIAVLGPRHVVLKLGADGCYALIDGQGHRVPAPPIAAVDTVGAGDAFVAGYLADLLDGRPVQSALLTAVRSGAFACLTPGDWEGMPYRRDLDLLGAAEAVAR